MKRIKIDEAILSANDLIARENRAIFDRHRALVLNIISAPGAGKTSLIRSTIEKLSDLRIVVIEGDITGSLDAQRLEDITPHILQINTGSACHLDARMIRSALDYLPPGPIDLILIENVGNLVCPAEFRVGEDHKIALISTAEGDDKPLKYPLLFQLASLLLINKIDLLPHTDFSIDRAIRWAGQINPKIETITLSCKTGEGLERWIEWISRHLNAKG
ncbi:hydrogenase accessory protein HypB [candidate division WOR-3 bacterium]|uniref:Hydrogenase accessory protein HypB n=1 Tax=candidate division WOR-3 bacterium TaxID=2052148 RepID=A0A660SGF7_UNCW3|nr:MAG: hydrogenase accessory protein HypB [candidate division WOR-3 bacterium]